MIRNLLALFAGVAAGFAVFAFLGLTMGVMPDSGSGYILLGSLLGVTAIIAVYAMLEQKRHVEFYADESGKTEAPQGDTGEEERAAQRHLYGHGCNRGGDRDIPEKPPARADTQTLGVLRPTGKRCSSPTKTPSSRQCCAA